MSGERTVIAPDVRYRRWRDHGFSTSDDGTLLYQAGLAQDRRFTWFDRRGKVLALIGPRNDFFGFNLAPDERHLALWSRQRPRDLIANRLDYGPFADGAVSRFSEPGSTGPEFLPVWSPDSSELLFSRGDETRMTLLVSHWTADP